jgi:GNAT superfamily N-acetyltransferase
MATRRHLQSQGVGSSLLTAGFAHWRDLADIVWANARDAALPFYARHGFSIRGPGFIESVTELPHHVVVRDLDSRTP